MACGGRGPAGAGVHPGPRRRGRPRNSRAREACGGDQGGRCQVVTLGVPGRPVQAVHLLHKKYSDVRLAFAPEDRAATFGGRDLTPSASPASPSMRPSSAWRADDAPAATPTPLLVWNTSKPVEDTPVFVSGSPGATQAPLTKCGPGRWPPSRRGRRHAAGPVDRVEELRGSLIRYSEEGERQAFEGERIRSWAWRTPTSAAWAACGALTDPGFMRAEATPPRRSSSAARPVGQQRRISSLPPVWAQRKANALQPVWTPGTPFSFSDAQQATRANSIPRVSGPAGGRARAWAPPRSPAAVSGSCSCGPAP